MFFILLLLLALFVLLFFCIMISLLIIFIQIKQNKKTKNQSRQDSNLQPHVLHNLKDYVSFSLSTHTQIQRITSSIKNYC